MSSEPLVFLGHFHQIEIWAIVRITLRLNTGTSDSHYRVREYIRNPCLPSYEGLIPLLLIDMD